MLQTNWSFKHAFGKRERESYIQIERNEATEAKSMRNYLKGKTGIEQQPGDRVFLPQSV